VSTAGPAAGGAYGGRPPALVGRWVPAGALVVAGACLLVAGLIARDEGPLAVGGVVLGLGVAVLAALPMFVRRPSSPFSVGAPGIVVGAGAGAPRRVVHWEAVAAVVLFVEGSGQRPRAVGLRLRRDPDTVSVVRRLDRWSMDRTRLERAVTRFAPPGVVVEVVADTGLPARDEPIDPGAPGALRP
jgi:hypothetical protein